MKQEERMILQDSKIITENRAKRLAASFVQGGLPQRCPYLRSYQLFSYEKDDAELGVKLVFLSKRT